MSLLKGLVKRTQNAFFRPKMSRIKRKNIVISFLFFFSFLLSFSIFLTTFQRFLIYCERPFDAKSENDIFAAKNLNSEDHSFWIKENLRGYWFPSTYRDSDNKKPKEGDVKTILYFHGQGAKLEWVISTFIEWNKVFPVNLMSVSYRGFGLSTGTIPHQEGIILDAEAALNFLCGDRKLRETANDAIPTLSKVVVFGHSLGGAVALHLTVLHPNKVSHLIVENTFIKIVRTLVTRYYMGFFAHLLSYCSLDPWDNEKQLEILVKKYENNEYVPKIKFISGLNDKKIPHWHTQTLYEGVSNYKFINHDGIPEKCHNTCYLENAQIIKDFLDTK